MQQYNVTCNNFACLECNQVISTTNENRLTWKIVSTKH